jgi:nucleoid DNA-binding protein
MRNAVPDIIAQLASEFGLPERTVEKAVKHQFRYTAHVMKNAEDFPTIRLQYIGSFSLNPKRKKYLDERDQSS